jgi:hypothetical protein
MPLTIIDEDERITVEIGDATIFCRRMPDEVLREIERKYRIRRKDGQGRTYFETNPDQTDERIAEIWDYIITGWENVVHPTTGAAVPCDAYHKMRLGGAAYERISEALQQGATPPDPTRTSGPPSGGVSASRDESARSA